MGCRYGASTEGKISKEELTQIEKGDEPPRF